MPKPRMLPKNRFSLGIEELALALGLINRPDLGHDLLISVYDNLTDEQVNERLTSASHSMIAHGFCGISNRGSPVLTQELELAIFPLAQFDHLMQVTIIRGEAKANTTVHIVKDKFFTSHFVEMGIVHNLEYGKYSGLLPYLLDIFGKIGITGKPKTLQTNGLTLKLSTLGQAIDGLRNKADIIQMFIGEGWAPAEAALLFDDLNHQRMRGTLLSITATSEMSLKDIGEIPAWSLLVLHGDERSWIFEFPSTKDQTLGSAQIVSRQDFEKLLSTFIQIE